MGFSRKSSSGLTEKDFEELKRPLTKEEQLLMDAELDEMARAAEMDTRSEADVVGELMTRKGSMDCPKYFDGKYKKYLNNNESDNE